MLVYKEAKLLKSPVKEIDKDAFVTEFEATSVCGGSTSDAYISNKAKTEVLQRTKIRMEK